MMMMIGMYPKVQKFPIYWNGILMRIPISKIKGDRVAQQTIKINFLPLTGSMDQEMHRYLQELYIKPKCLTTELFIYMKRLQNLVKYEG